MDSRAHDTLVALTSHVPHLMASLTGARLREGPSATEALIGQGARDVTRIAAGDPALWIDIVRSNAPAVAAVLRHVRDDVTSLLAAVDVLAVRGSDHEDPAGHAAAEHTVTDLLRRGADGAARTRPRAGRGATTSTTSTTSTIPAG
jgi:prephenate dehydrogenase